MADGPMAPDLMVFTDLDGTLLDHDEYSFKAARPALEALRRRGVPLILATSKTAAEVAPLHNALGLAPWPAIVENGAALVTPGDGETDAASYGLIRRALADMPPDLSHGFHGFGDMTDAEVAAITGLDLAAAIRARQRQFTEPGLWRGDAAGRARFVAHLVKRGIHAREGGRFLTLSLGHSKADQMRRLITRHRPRHTLALGDAPNDVEMLDVAEFGVIVRNDHGPGIPPLPGEADGRIRRTSRPGPEGWNTAVLSILSEIQGD